LAPPVDVRLLLSRAVLSFCITPSARPRPTRSQRDPTTRSPWSSPLWPSPSTARAAGRGCRAPAWPWACKARSAWSTARRTWPPGRHPHGQAARHRRRPQPPGEADAPEAC